MRRRFELTLIPILAGCAAPDPAEAPLAPGAAAVAVDGSDRNSARVVVDTERSKMEMIAVGTRLRVAEDRPDARKGRYRDVRVLILEGEHAGEPATIARMHLRVANPP
jgi:hypothetical protein